MITNECKKFLTWLETWDSDQQPLDSPPHARGCSSCRAVFEDLKAIHAEAHTWSANEPEPPAHIWSSLHAQLKDEGLIRTPEAERVSPPVVSSPGWFANLFAQVPRPVLAGAYLSLLVAAGFALSGPFGRPSNEAIWLQGTQVVASPLSAQLDTFEQNPMASRGYVSPAVAASLHQNLAIVDNYISLCEKSVQEEPENEVARDYLFEAYQQKADLLAQINERGENVQ
ncbi:MAG TPA: hypothetical protein VGD60_15445 [Candidatus Acidoferrales bacterium]